MKSLINKSTIVSLILTCSGALTSLQATAEVIEEIVETSIFCTSSKGDAIELIDQEDKKVIVSATLIDGIYIVESELHEKMLGKCRTYLNSKALSWGDKQLIGRDGFVIMGQADYVVTTAATSGNPYRDSLAQATSKQMESVSNRKARLLEKKISALEAELAGLKNETFAKRFTSFIKSSAKMTGVILVTAAVTSVCKDGGDTVPTLNLVKDTLTKVVAAIRGAQAGAGQGAAAPAGNNA